jgi:hypothetical protein
MREAFLAFARKVNGGGRLVLMRDDFVDPERWKALGYFLAACPDISALRLQGSWLHLRSPSSFFFAFALSPLLLASSTY